MSQNQDPLEAFVDMTRIASEMLSGLHLVAAAKVVLKQLAESMKDTLSQDQMDKLNKLMEER